MDGKTFKARLVMIDMTQIKFANTIETSTRTLNRWLNSTSIPKVVIMALESLEHQYKNHNE